MAACELEAGIDRSCAQAPTKCCPHIFDLLIQTPQPSALVWRCQAWPCLAAKIAAIVRMPALEVGALAGLSQLLETEIANSLQHTESHFAIGTLILLHDAVFYKRG